MLLSCLGKRTTCAPEQIHVKAIAFVNLEYEQNSSSKSNQSCRQYPVDRLTGNYIRTLIRTDSHEIMHSV